MIKNKDINFLIIKYIFSFLILGFGFLVINNPVATSQAVSVGIHICIDVVIPSLFPFMVVGSFLTLSPSVDIISKLFAPITKKIFNMPEQIGCLILMSFFGGYPLGAKMISVFLRGKQINLKTAERLLCYCINGGPAFIITAIGYMMWHSKTIGIILFVSHILGSVIIGWMLGFFVNDEKINDDMIIEPVGYAEAFVKSVIDSCYALLNICAFIIIFSVITQILQKSGMLNLLSIIISKIFFNLVNDNIVSSILISCLEVTNGMYKIVNMGGVFSLMLCSFFISFAGLSIIFQVFSYISEYNIDKKKIILFRIIHASLSSLLTLILIILIPGVEYTSTVLYNDVSFFQVTPLISFLLFYISLCFIICSYNNITK